MTKKEYMKTIADNYYLDKEISLGELRSQIKLITPIFGEIQTKILKDDKGYTISLLDYDKVTSVLRFDANADKMIEVELTEEEVRRYSTCTTIIEMTTSLEGIIETASCSINGFVTPANRDFNLFIGYLIGKKVTEIF